MYWADDVDYEPVFRLGNTFKESLRMMSEVEQLTARFPGSGLRFLRRSHLPDSGGRHCPGRRHAERLYLCSPLQYRRPFPKIRHLTRERESGDSMPEEDKVLLRKYISELTTDLASFGVPERQKRKD